MNDGWRVGDYLVCCDRSGFVCWASETVKEWNGLRVRKDFADKQRHPQDMVRTLPERTTVPNPRPEPEDVFLASRVLPSDL